MLDLATDGQLNLVIESEWESDRDVIDLDEVFSAVKEAVERLVRKHMKHGEVKTVTFP